MVGSLGGFSIFVKLLSCTNLDILRDFRNYMENKEIFGGLLPMRTPCLDFRVGRPERVLGTTAANGNGSARRFGQVHRRVAVRHSKEAFEQSDGYLCNEL
jgi:hypothetical protein